MALYNHAYKGEWTSKRMETIVKLSQSSQPADLLGQRNLELMNPEASWKEIDSDPEREEFPETRLLRWVRLQSSWD